MNLKGYVQADIAAKTNLLTQETDKLNEMTNKVALTQAGYQM